jgi:hypothetical protein
VQDITNHQENANQSQKKIQPCTCWHSYKEELRKQISGGCGKVRALAYHWWEWKPAQHDGKQMEVSQKLKIKLL